MRLQGPPDFNGRISVGGMEFDSSDGQVDVPAHIAADLIKYHGFEKAAVIEISTKPAPAKGDGKAEAKPDGKPAAGKADGKADGKSAEAKS